MIFWSDSDREEINDILDNYQYGNIFTNELFPYLNLLDKDKDEEIAVKKSSKGFHMHIKHTDISHPVNTMFISVDLQQNSPRMNLYQELRVNEKLKLFGKGLFGYTHLQVNHLTDTWKEWIKDSYKQRLGY